VPDGQLDLALRTELANECFILIAFFASQPMIKMGGN
jgi:hypothetical protein